MISDPASKEDLAPEPKDLGNLDPSFDKTYDDSQVVKAEVAPSLGADGGLSKMSSFHVKPLTKIYGKSTFLKGEPLSPDIVQNYMSLGGNISTYPSALQTRSNSQMNTMQQLYCTHQSPICSKAPALETTSSQKKPLSQRVLNLGLPKNYKVKVIQDRWEQQREKWLLPPVNDSAQPVEDVREGIPSAHLQKGSHRRSFELNSEASIAAAKARKIMKSQTGPYKPFESYHPLKDVVTSYVEIWYGNESSQSSDSRSCNCDDVVNVCCFCCISSTCKKTVGFNGKAKIEAVTAEPLPKTAIETKPQSLISKIRGRNLNEVGVKPIPSTPQKTVQIDTAADNQRTPRGLFSFFFQNKVSNQSEHQPSVQTEPSKPVNPESPDCRENRMPSPVGFGGNSSKVNSRQYFADESQFGSIAVDKLSKNYQGVPNDTIDPSLFSPHTARRPEGKQSRVSFAYNNGPLQLNGTEGNLETLHSRANLQPIGDSLQIEESQSIGRKLEEPELGGENRYTNRLTVHCPPPVIPRKSTQMVTGKVSPFKLVHPLDKTKRKSVGQ